LYSYEQMMKAFKAGRDKGQADITGDSGIFENFYEFISSQDYHNISKTRLKQLEWNTQKILVGDFEPLTMEVVARSVTSILRQRGYSMGLEVADYSEIVGNRRRFRRYVLPTHVCFYIIWVHTPHTLTQIGEFFGGRDHATVLHGAKTISQDIETNRQVRTLVKYVYDDLETRGYDVFTHYNVSTVLNLEKNEQTLKTA